ncbi:MAG: CCA tRNA nucleotidyltransferase [Pseudomonadota bacterium]
MLTAAGHQAWFVGGCVRNALLGSPVSDLDITTDARPDRVRALAKAAGFRAIPTGIDHGTITVVADGHAFEITTFRKDVETDGRHAVVAFADTLEEDAARRDFTVNALYADPTGAVRDPVGGLPDLDQRRFRFIGAPHDRIREDYLRILRFFRFFAWYGAELDADGLAACAELADGITTLSAERVTTELLKLLSAPDPLRAVAAMEQSGVLAQVLPGASARMLGPYLHLDPISEIDPIARLSSLNGDASSLRLSRAQSRALNDYQTAMSSADTPGVLGYRLGHDTGARALALQAAALEQPYPEQALTQLKRGADATFPIRAADLPKTFTGPAIGQALKRLERAWIDANFEPTKAELLAQL